METTRQILATYLGRTVVKEIVFTQKGTFQAYYAARDYLYANGYSSGSSCVSGPTGITHRKWDLPQKWKNMSIKERNSVDGVMDGETREGPVRLIFFNE